MLLRRFRRVLAPRSHARGGRGGGRGRGSLSTLELGCFLPLVHLLLLLSPRNPRPGLVVRRGVSSGLQIVWRPRRRIQCPSRGRRRELDGGVHHEGIDVSVLDIGKDHARLGAAVGVDIDPGCLELVVAWDGRRQRLHRSLALRAADVGRKGDIGRRGTVLEVRSREVVQLLRRRGAGQAVNRAPPGHAMLLSHRHDVARLVWRSPLHQLPLPLTVKGHAQRLGLLLQLLERAVDPHVVLSLEAVQRARDAVLLLRPTLQRRCFQGPRSCSSLLRHRGRRLHRVHRQRAFALPEKQLVLRMRGVLRGVPLSLRAHGQLGSLRQLRLFFWPLRAHVARGAHDGLFWRNVAGGLVVRRHAPRCLQLLLELPRSLRENRRARTLRDRLLWRNVARVFRLPRCYSPHLTQDALLPRLRRPLLLLCPGTSTSSLLCGLQRKPGIPTRVRNDDQHACRRHDPDEHPRPHPCGVLQPWH